MIEVKEGCRDKFISFLYDLEGCEIPKGVHPNGKKKQHHHFVEKYLKPVLDDFVIKYWRLENSFDPDNGFKKGKKIDVWKKLLNDGLVDGIFSEKTLNAYVCYFLHHFLDEYYNSIVPIEYLNKLPNFFDSLKEKDTPKNYIIQIESIINYVLERHNSFDKKFSARINETVAEDKYKALSKIKCDVQYGLHLRFYSLNTEMEQVPLPPYIVSEKPPLKSESLNVGSGVPSNKMKPHTDEQQLYIEQILDNIEYNLYLRKQFGTIRLTIADFEIPIDDYIKLPLLKSDEFLKEELKNYEEHYKSLELNEEHNQTELQTLNEKIKKIQSVLFKKHDINTILTLGKDIFIEAPAGNGKSTLLKYLAYEHSKTGLFKPVFIELMYNTSDNLKQVLNDKLEQHKLENGILKDYPLLLLLDGFDQFSGNQNKLFGDIKWIKEQFNAQIVFTGRELPNYEIHNLDLAVYNLNSFANEDLQKLSKSYLGYKNGEQFYRYISDRGLEKYINKPLYFCFLLAYTKKKLDLGENDFNEVALLIKNKSRLFQSVVVDNFIGKYERERTEISRTLWKETKLKEVELIAHLAHAMTFQLKGVETIEKSKAKALLDGYCKTHTDFKEIDISQVLDNFVEYHILELKEGLLSFEKKELRLFFTAKAQSKSITSFRKLLKSRQASNQFRYIEPYVIGLTDANLILKELDSIDVNEALILNGQFIEQFKIAIRFFDQQNYPNKLKHINTGFLVSIFKLILSKYQLATTNVKSPSTLLSIRPVLGYLLNNNTFLKKNFAKGLENKINRHFFRHNLHFDHFTEGGYAFEDFVEYLIKHDIGLSFKQLLRVIKDIDHSNFEQNRSYIYLNLIKQRYDHSITSEERAEIAYDFISNPYYSIEYEALFPNKSKTMSNRHPRWFSSLHSFVINTLTDHSASFVNLVFDRNETLLPFTWKRYLYFKKESRTHWAHFEEGGLKEGYQFRLFELLKEEALNAELKSNLFHQFEYLLNTSTDIKLIDLFCDYFSHFLSSSTDKQKNLVAYSYLFSRRRTKDVNMFIEIFKDNDKEKINLFLEALTNYYPLSVRHKNDIYDERLILLFQFIFDCGNLPLSVAKEMLLNIKYTNSSLNSTIIALIDANKEIDFVHYACLFMSKHKVKESIPVLESLLDGYYGLQAYYNLSRLDSSLFEKYKSLFTKDYNDTYKLIENFKTAHKKEFDPYLLNVAYLVGDEKLLRLMRDIALNHNDNIHTNLKKRFETVQHILKEKIEGIMQNEKTS